MAIRTSGRLDWSGGGEFEASSEHSDLWDEPVGVREGDVDDTGAGVPLENVEAIHDLGAHLLDEGGLELGEVVLGHRGMSPMLEKRRDDGGVRETCLLPFRPGVEFRAPLPDEEVEAHVSTLQPIP